MERQYNAPRFRYDESGRRVGTIPVGTILYIQDRLQRYQSPVRRNPWIVECWHNREYHPCVKGRPDTTYMVGGHLATVRSLRTGERRKVSDHWLLMALENE